MGRLLQAASLLGHGAGLSCGVASRAELNRLELEPAEQVRALLRLADAEQYRQKLADATPRCRPALGSRAHGVRPPTSASSPTPSTA